MDWACIEGDHVEVTAEEAVSLAFQLSDFYFNFKKVIWLETGAQFGATITNVSNDFVDVLYDDTGTIY